MFEIILFIIIIIAVGQASKKKRGSAGRSPKSSYSQKQYRSGGSSGSASSASGTFHPGSASSASVPNTDRSGAASSDVFSSYRRAANAGERYEEWMPVPEGKRVCRCGYCGADNLIPKNSDPKDYTCYFCREDL